MNLAIENKIQRGPLCCELSSVEKLVDRYYAGSNNTYGSNTGKIVVQPIPNFEQ